MPCLRSAPVRGYQDMGMHMSNNARAACSPKISRFATPGLDAWEKNSSLICSLPNLT